MPTSLDFLNLALETCPGLLSGVATETESNNAAATQQTTIHMAHYIAELSLHSADIAECWPSCVGAACLLLALALTSAELSGTVMASFCSVWRNTPTHGHTSTSQEITSDNSGNKAVSSGLCLSDLRPIVEALHAILTAPDDPKQQVSCRWSAGSHVAYTGQC